MTPNKVLDVRTAAAGESSHESEHADRHLHDDRCGGRGRQLIGAAIERARKLGATTLFLGSSTKLPNAVHLYETAGFQHVSPEQIPLPPYARADVFMAMAL